MKVIVFIKANEKSEAGVLPSQQLLTEMMQFNEELVRSGVMLAGEGLRPSSRGVRVQYRGGKMSVLDGPFAETKELIAGFWIWNVESMDQAIALAKRIPNPDNEEGEVEIRPVFEADDFAENLTPELREQEQRLRAEVAARQ